MSDVVDNAVVYEVNIEGVFANAEYKGFKLSWSSDIGFGELVIFQYPNGKIRIDSETLGKEFCQKVLKKLLENGKMEWED